MCRSGCRRLPDAPPAPVSPRLVRFRVPRLRSPSEVSFSPCSLGGSCPDRTCVACVPLTCLPHRWPQTGALKATGCFLPQSWATGVRCRSRWAAAALPLGLRPAPNGGLPGSPRGSASPGGRVAPGSASDRPSPPPLRCVPSSPLLPS